ncbi:MAG: hypothetical protein V4532_07035 [Pseudomonadota bacterium]
MKIIVGLSWLLGIGELIHPITPIPRSWLLTVVGLSLLAHACQSVYFVRKFGRTVDSVWPHVLQIMVFGMPHIVAFQKTGPQGVAPLAR